MNARIQYTAQYHLHKLNPYASIQSKYTFARTYANSIFTGSIFEWLPIRSVTELRNEMKRKGRKENERKRENLWHEY